MCGLIGSVGAPTADVESALIHVAHRGPDGHGIWNDGSVSLGHTRLAIIDPTPGSDQPFVTGRVVLTFNGELWNYRELKAELEMLGVSFSTTGDTEVVAEALNLWSTDALPRFDGMFALAWYDGETTRLARDRYGEIPLHYARRFGQVWWSSELKALDAVGCARRSFTDVRPGEIVEIRTQNWIESTTWYTVPEGEEAIDLVAASAEVGEMLRSGTVERGLAADVPVCTLLSGGIDSAAVALHLTETLGDSLVAYTAVLDPKSRDLRCARAVADGLGIKLVEVSIDPPTADDLASVVAEIEMPHKAQVEIGWACLQLAERIRDDGFKVTFSGEGSDELWASYGMSYHGIEKEGWGPFRRRTFYDQHRKNFARCNKVFMARSVEVRLPFLHRPLVERALSLPPNAVRDGRAKPKAVLTEAYRGRLPDEVVDRSKVAFQVGLKLTDACAEVVADPKRFYLAEWRRLYE